MKSNLNLRRVLLVVEERLARLLVLKLFCFSSKNCFFPFFEDCAWCWGTNNDLTIRRATFFSSFTCKVRPFLTTKFMGIFWQKKRTNLALVVHVQTRGQLDRVPGELMGEDVDVVADLHHNLGIRNDKLTTLSGLRTNNEIGVCNHFWNGEGDMKECWYSSLYFKTLWRAHIGEYFFSHSATIEQLQNQQLAPFWALCETYQDSIFSSFLNSKEIKSLSITSLGSIIVELDSSFSNRSSNFVSSLIDTVPDAFTEISGRVTVRRNYHSQVAGR